MIMLHEAGVMETLMKEVYKKIELHVCKSILQFSNFPIQQRHGL